MKLLIVFISFLSSFAYGYCSCDYSHGGYIVRCGRTIAAGPFRSQYECSERARALGSNSTINDPKTCSCYGSYSSVYTTLHCDGQIKGSFRSSSDCSGFIATLIERRESQRRW